MDYPKSISKEAINELPQQDFLGKIHLILTPEDAEQAALELSKATILGFDTETRPSFSANQQYQVSLLQLVTETDAYLFRLRGTGLPAGLTAVMSNPAILKVGVAIRDDLKALQKLAPFTPEGFIDIAHEAEKRGFKNFGLRGLTAIFLGTRLSKTAKLTNWDNERLSQAQLLYAANDGVVSIGIYHKLMPLPVTQTRSPRR